MKSIKEYILDVIQESYVFEMAYNRKEIKKRVEALINQIIENWCLIKYCSLYDKNNINKYIIICYILDLIYIYCLYTLAWK